MAIVIRFIGDAKSFLKSVDKSIKKTELFSKKSTTEFKKVSKAVARWGTATALAASAASIAIFKSTSSSIKELKILANVANTATDEFQRGAFAAQRAGIPMEKYGDILKDVNDRIGDFISTGGGEMVDFFEQIAPKVGVTAESFKNLSGQESLGLFVSSLEKANLSSKEMTFFMEAMANNSTRLLPLFKENGKLLKEFSDEAKALGVGLSKIDLQRVEEANRQLSAVGEVIDIALQEAVVQLSPFVTALGQEFVNTANDAGGMNNIVSKAMSNITERVGGVLDAFHNISIILKGVELSVRGFNSSSAEAFAGFINEIADGIGELSNLILVPFQISAKLATMLPGMAGELGEAVNKSLDEISVKLKGLEGPQGLIDFANAQTEALIIARDEFSALFDSDAPSDRLNKLAQKIIETAEKVKTIAPQVIDDKTKGAEGAEGVEVDSGANELKRQHEEERLQIIRDSMFEEEEILANAFTRRIEMLQEARDNEIISEDEFRAVSKSHEKKFMDDMVAIREEGAKSISALVKQQYGQDAAGVVDSFKQMVNTAGEGSKKMFKISKMLGMADAAISMYQGIAAGLKLGWPLSIPAVAFAAVNGAMAIANIRKQTYGGGGGGSGGAASAASAPAASQAPAAPQQQQRAQQVANISISGDNFGRKGLISLAEQMNELIQDGVTSFSVA